MLVGGDPTLPDCPPIELLERLLELDADALEITEPSRLSELSELFDDGVESRDVVVPDWELNGPYTEDDELTVLVLDPLDPLRPPGWAETDWPSDGGGLPGPVEAGESVESGGDPVPPFAGDSAGPEPEPPPGLDPTFPDPDAEPPRAEPPAG